MLVRIQIYKTLFVDSSKANPGEIARLESPKRPATMGDCARFWFYLYGSSNLYGALNVYAKTEQGLGKPLWSITKSVRVLRTLKLFKNRFRKLVSNIR